MNLKSETGLQGGKYRIVRVLGQGGFGITYLAVNTLFDRKVAIKEFFPKDFCGRDNTSHVTIGTQNNVELVEKLKGRFLKEAKNIAKLDHPGIVGIHDVFEENNSAYYVMDYIEGENLHELVKRNGPLTEAKAVEYVRKVGEALAYIHSKNMTHFDVKPSNVMIRTTDQSPVLIDFGLSKQYDRTGQATSTIIQGVSKGYSPIELYNAGSLTEFSPQTDVYSLGATLYYLLSGETPPAHTDIMETGLNIPANIDVKVSEFICQTMQIPRTKRPASVTKALEILPAEKKRRKTTQSTGDETRLLNDPETEAELTRLRDQVAQLCKDNKTLDRKATEREKVVSSLRDQLRECSSKTVALEKEATVWKQQLNKNLFNYDTLQSNYNKLNGKIKGLKKENTSLASLKRNFTVLFVISFFGLLISVPTCMYKSNKLSNYERFYEPADPIVDDTLSVEVAEETVVYWDGKPTVAAPEVVEAAPADRPY